MEEVNDLDMGLFGNGFELNTQFNFPNPDDNPEDEIIEEDPLKNINKTVEDEVPEEVDSEEDEQIEGGDNADASSSNLFSSVAALVHEQGFLPSLDIEKTKIETPEDLTNVLNNEIELRAKSKFEEFVSNIDIENIAQSKKNIQDLNTITEDSLKENIELAKKIIYDDYLNQGLDETKATRMLKRLIDLGEDAILEDAAESLLSLKEFNTRQIESEKENTLKQIENEKLAQAQLDANLKKIIYESKDLINGYKPTKALQDKVYNSINEIVGKSPEGYFENKFMKERRENPIEFETRMYMFYELTNGFKDFSKISTSAKSTAVKDLEKIAQQTKIKDNGTPIWMQDNNSYGGVGVELNI